MLRCKNCQRVTYLDPYNAEQVPCSPILTCRNYQREHNNIIIKVHVANEPDIT